MSNKIDNFEKIKSLLSFQNDDEFYHLQILKRKKENPEIGSNSYVIKTYYISSLDYLDKKKKEIVELCHSENARAYINLNPKSYEQAAYQTLKKITNIIMNKAYSQCRKAFDSVAGSLSATRDKKWIIDIDEPAWSPLMLTRINYHCEPICDDVNDTKVYDIIPTKNGFHIITKPFNLKKFRENYPDIDIHKNNPTILYIP